MLEVTAPILEAQLVETIIINEIQLQTMVASKAARCVTAGGGRGLIDFALRRTQAPDAGLRVARASYLAGFDGTSNVRAGQLYDIPIAGTMAHSFVQSFPSELEAFRAYARAYPSSAVLLLDTYDTIAGAHDAVVVGRELAERGYRLRGVRLDSGDLIGLSQAVRRILDEAGLLETIIFASGNLDEYAVERAVAEEAPINGFGVGTRMGVVADAPYLELAYKLVSYDGRPTLKLSADKASLPGPKQVWRAASNGQSGFTEDWLGLASEAGPAGFAPLLAEVMTDGHRVSPPESLEHARARARQQLTALPAGSLRLRDPDPYPVHRTPALGDLEREIRSRGPTMGGVARAGEN
jgi:nicotinate phosphoribosyltransferase